MGVGVGVGEGTAVALAVGVGGGAGVGAEVWGSLSAAVAAGMVQAREPVMAWRLGPASRSLGEWAKAAQSSE